MTVMPQRATQRHLIRALLVELARVRRDTAADLAGAPEDMRKVVVAQNALRTCMEAAVADAIPFGPVLPVELAIRMASYAVSLLPDSEHEGAIAAVVAHLPGAHRERMARGVRISTDWGRPH